MTNPRQPQPSFMVGDAEYLKALSGYKQKTAIASWCTRNRIKFFRNAQGWPVTTAAALENALAGGERAQPDWSYFDGWKTGTHWRHKRLRAERGIPEPPPTAPRPSGPKGRTQSKRASPSKAVARISAWRR